MPANLGTDDEETPMSEDTYLSHPVRRMREDPLEGEDI
jgi:hypothetical protein